MSEFQTEVLRLLSNGGYSDWKFLENICELHKIEASEILDMAENFGEGKPDINLFIMCAFDYIKNTWDAYITEKADNEFEGLELNYFINYLDSHIDTESRYQWDMTPEEAYKKWKGISNE